MATNAQPDDDQRLRDLQREYVELLEDESGSLRDLVQDLIEKSESRLIVNINEIRARKPARARGLMSNFFEEMTAFQRALKEFIGSMDPEIAKSRVDFLIGLEGSFGGHHLNPRTLMSSHLNHLVCLEGIVTKVSMINPKIIQSVHYCQATEKTMERNYTDLVSLEAFPSSAAYPTQDEDGNPLQTEYGLSLYKDHQTISIQELPEKAPTGQLPRAVDVICENDMVDKCKPGDRIQIVGSYRCLPSKQGGFTSGTFRSVVLANNIIPLKKTSDVLTSGDDIEKIKKVAKSEKNIFETLAKSLAPSIHGNEFVKKALLCQLLGGVEKTLPNGSRLRGDINVLLIGDPSVAKSQLLRYVLSTAERAVTTTGRGSSGVGLTAAVTTDQETGERRLEAGAMVLADQGIVCIDEFDKMTDMDRTAIHEVMEQGKVTISKAGIHARLNARCSVLAAANPVYGRYDIYKSPMENIGLQDSLLSRFDMLFVMLDTIDVENDKKISDHVVCIHRYRSSKEADGMVTDVVGGIDDLDTRKAEASKEKESIWDKHNKIFHTANSSREKFLSAEFVKKYISYAKTLAPVLTDKACEIIAEEYSQIRSQVCDGTDTAKTQPITARSLETMIRLATAHAKARLSSKVEKKDAELAIRLVQFALFKKVVEKEKKKRRHDESDDGQEVESEDENDEHVANDSAVAPSPKRARPDTSSGTPDISKEKLETFKKNLADMFQGTQTLQINDVIKKMEEKKICNKDEVFECVRVMSDENRVMLSGEVLYWI